MSTYDGILTLLFSLLAWLPVVAIIIVAIRHAFADEQSDQLGRCIECAYDLTGNESGVCPECGTPSVRHGLFKKLETRRRTTDQHGH